MKFFHTADWHLGKIVQGVSMLEDQAYIIDQFLKEIEKERPNAVIIAGDIYDRAIPPPEAIHLFYRTIKKIVIDFEIPLLVISGNHDSPSRLNFATSLMKDKGFHLVSELDPLLKSVVIKDEFGPVYFHMIPYCDPS